MKFERINSLPPSSERKIIDTAVLVQGIHSLGFFFLAAYLFAHFAHPRPFFYLGFHKPRNKIAWILVLLIMLGLTPFLLAISEWISRLEFLQTFRQAQEKQQAMMNALIVAPTWLHFIWLIVVLAVITGICEEVFFRGVVMKLIAKKSRTMMLPIVLSALIFTLVHGDIFGKVSIFLAGMVLACIYLLTGSIWYSIAAHAFHNGTQLVMVNMLKDSSPDLQKLAMQNIISPLVVVAGLVISGVSFYLLWKNRTPLPKTWTNDFTEEELLQQQNDLNPKI